MDTRGLLAMGMACCPCPPMWCWPEMAWVGIMPFRPTALPLACNK